MSEGRDQTCRRNCWLIAALGAVLTLALLRVLAGYPYGTALFAGLAFFGLFGVFLAWAFCSGQSDAASWPIVPMPEVDRKPPVPEPAAAPLPRANQSAAPVAPAAPVVVPAVAPPVKPRAAGKPRSAGKPMAKTRTGAVKSPPPAAAVKAAKSPRASGLDAAMGRTKDAAAPAAAPVFLTGPRSGKGDDLKAIRGVGPALEKLLNSIGVWHFDQIAAWKAKDIALVDGKMEGFKGRITRDEWVKQARLLARGA